MSVSDASRNRSSIRRGFGGCSARFPRMRLQPRGSRRPKLRRLRSRTCRIPRGRIVAGNPVGTCRNPSVAGRARRRRRSGRDLLLPCWRRCPRRRGRRLVTDLRSSARAVVCRSSRSDVRDPLVRARFDMRGAAQRTFASGLSAFWISPIADEQRECGASWQINLYAGRPAAIWLQRAGRAADEHWWRLRGHDRSSRAAARSGVDLTRPCSAL